MSTATSRSGRLAQRAPEMTPDADGSPDARFPLLRWQGIAALVLSLVGLGDSIYVTYIHYSNTVAACPATTTIDCVKVLTSPQSMVFGLIPVPLIGLGYFLVMTVLNLPPLWRSANPWIARLRLALVIGGMGMVIYLIFTELFTIGSICLWCTGVHLVTFLLLLLVVGTYPTMTERWTQWEPTQA